MKNKSSIMVAALMLAAFGTGCISRILQRRDGGKDPLAAWLDFCHGLLKDCCA